MTGWITFGKFLKPSTLIKLGTVCLLIMPCPNLILAQPSPPKKLPPTSEPTKFTFEQPHLGTTIKLTVYAPESGIANQAAESSFAVVRRLDAVFSSYRTDSELVQLHREYWSQGNSTAFPISPDFYRVLKRSVEISRLTDGAFDCTVGPFARIWKRAIRHRSVPEESAMEQVAGRVGYDLLQLEDRQQTVKFLREKMRLDFSGIAKGYIADQTLAELKRLGIRRALVDAGGDLAIGDPPPNQSGWRVIVDSGTASPDGAIPTEFCARNCGIATSGSAFQRLEVNGERHSHIVDPRTGHAVTHRLTVTTFAEDAMTADALASAVSACQKGEAAKFLAAFPRAAWLSIPDGGSASDSERAAFCRHIFQHNASRARRMKPQESPPDTLPK